MSVETRVQDCSALALSVLCVTLTCCSCRGHGKHFHYLRVCETIVHFVLTDLDADLSSPALQRNPTSDCQQQLCS